MAEITAALVKDLREKSGAGMMDCKRALQETEGVIDAAIDWLRTKGLSKAAKKADRVAAEGLVAIATGGTQGAVVEVNAETDFVSRNEMFQAAAAKTARAALANGDNVDTIMASDSGDGTTISDMLTNLIATIGENMVVRRAVRLEVSQGVVASYMHNFIATDLGRMGVLVALESAADVEALRDLGRKIAMHVAATAPLSLNTDDLDPAAVERERTILTDKAREDGRPENMIAKIVDGQVAKFQKEVVLLKQPFVMNPDQTIEQLIADTGKSLGSPITIKAFVRFALGDGIEKKVDDFAAEVSAMTSGQA
jgi:elongation factor Ts